MGGGGVLGGGFTGVWSRGGLGVWETVVGLFSSAFSGLAGTTTEFGWVFLAWGAAALFSSAFSGLAKVAVGFSSTSWVGVGAALFSLVSTGLARFAMLGSTSWACVGVGLFSLAFTGIASVSASFGCMSGVGGVAAVFSSALLGFANVAAVGW